MESFLQLGMTFFCLLSFLGIIVAVFAFWMSYLPWVLTFDSGSIVIEGLWEMMVPGDRLCLLCLLKSLLLPRAAQIYLSELTVLWGFHFY